MEQQFNEENIKKEKSIYKIIILVVILVILLITAMLFLYFSKSSNSIKYNTNNREAINVSNVTNNLTKSHEKIVKDSNLVSVSVKSKSHKKIQTLDKTEITISGIVKYDSISGAKVQLQNFKGDTLATATTNSKGMFSTKTLKSNINQGYTLVATGGKIKGKNFKGRLSAQYSIFDNRNDANITLITTLITRIVKQDTSDKTALEKHNDVLKRLEYMGVIYKNDWNTLTPRGVRLNQLRDDTKRYGLGILNELAVDLKNSVVSDDDMKYFPLSNGGIYTMAIMSSVHNSIPVSSGASGQVIVTVLGDGSGSYSYKIVSGPDWITLKPSGHKPITSISGYEFITLISYKIPNTMKKTSPVLFSIRAVNNITGFGRTMIGKFYIPLTEIVAQGIVGVKGGRISNAAGDIIAVIPAGSLTSPTLVKIETMRDSGGSVVVKVVTDKGNSNFLYTLHLPDPNVLDANTP